MVRSPSLPSTFSKWTFMLRGQTNEKCIRMPVPAKVYQGCTLYLQEQVLNHTKKLARNTWKWQTRCNQWKIPLLFLFLFPRFGQKPGFCHICGRNKRNSEGMHLRNIKWRTYKTNIQLAWSNCWGHTRTRKKYLHVVWTLVLSTAIACPEWVLQLNIHTALWPDHMLVQLLISAM